jgi:predicted dienelactone hydrolase
MRRTCPARIGTILLIAGLAMGVAQSLHAQSALSADPVEKSSVPLLEKSTPGPWSVKVIDEDWHDAVRDRSIPVRMYLPQRRAANGDAPVPASVTTQFPVIVFSHGLGASRASYGYFGRHMASEGYIVIAPTHPGSDTEQAKAWVKSHGGPETVKGQDSQEDRPLSRLRDRLPEHRNGQADGDNSATNNGSAGKGTGGWLMSSINDPDNLANRPKDISFVVDQIPGHKVLGPIADMQRIGVAGHSFGAYTAMAIGGMTVDLPEAMGGKAKSFRDPRVKAVLPMSPEGAGSMGIRAGAWDAFAAPALFLTGTEDYGSGKRSAAWRRQAFDAIHTVDDYLVTLNGAGHLTFANVNGIVPGKASAVSGGMLSLLAGSRDDEQQAHHVELIDGLSTLFFDAYVRGDAGAKERLAAFCAENRSDCAPEFHAAPAK